MNHIAFLSGLILSCCSGFGLLAQTISVQLECHDAATGQPVANRQVYLQLPQKERPLVLTTDEQGKITVEHLPAGQYQIALPDLPDFAALHFPKNGPRSYHIQLPYFYKIKNNNAYNSNTLPTYLQLCDAQDQPVALQERLTLRNNCGDSVHVLTTTAEGVAFAQLRLGCTYVLSLEGAPNYYKFRMPERPYAHWREAVFFERDPDKPLYPSMRLALFNCVFEDMKGKRVAGEQFWLENTQTGERYTATTNTAGIAQLQVPLGSSYHISATHNPRFAQHEAKLQPDQDLLIQTIVYQDLTQAQWLARQAEQEAQAAYRDSILGVERQRQLDRLQALRDAQEEARWLQEVVEEHQPLPIKRTLRIRKAVHAKAEHYQSQRQRHPRYAEDTRHPILAVLERHAEQWKGKVVVTDVTQSMEPYLDEVLIWHLLYAQQGDRVHYLFFNDGNGLAEAQKIDGHTGGLYSCQGTQQSLDTVLAKMAAAVAAGDGGTPPENDLEALLAALPLHQAGEELILIADSHSPIRDMGLLRHLQVPVRIILCGAEERNRLYRHLKPDVNEQYLDLARQTGGSVHTLHQDLRDLSQLPEGETVQLGRFRYILRHGHFIKLP